MVVDAVGWWAGLVLWRLGERDEAAALWLAHRGLSLTPPSLLYYDGAVEAARERRRRLLSQAAPGQGGAAGVGLPMAPPPESQLCSLDLMLLTHWATRRRPHGQQPPSGAAR